MAGWLLTGSTPYYRSTHPPRHPADPRLRSRLPSGFKPKTSMPVVIENVICESARLFPQEEPAHKVCGGLKRSGTSNHILEGSPRRPRLSLRFPMPEECMGVSKAAKESISLKTRKALTIDALPSVTFDCKSVVKNCLLQGHPVRMM